MVHYEIAQNSLLHRIFHHSYEGTEIKIKIQKEPTPKPYILKEGVSALAFRIIR